MTSYLMIMRTATGNAQWQSELHTASDRMAIDYTARISQQFTGVSWFMGIDLWEMSSERHIALITIADKAEAKVHLPEPTQ